MNYTDFLIPKKGRELTDYVLNNSDRKDLLGNKNIKDYFFEPDNHYPFVWLIQSLTDSELLIFFDKYAIEKVIDDIRVVDKINAIMTLHSYVKNDILNDDRIIKLIMDNGFLNSSMNYLGGMVCKSIFDKIIEKGNINLFGYMNNSELYTLVMNNAYKLKQMAGSEYLLCYLPIKAVNKLLDDSYFELMLYNFDISTINDLIVKGLVVPSNSKYIKRFIDKYLDINDIGKYRIFAQNLISNNYYLYETINNLRIKSYDTKINNMQGVLFDDYKVILNNFRFNQKIETSDYDFYTLLYNNKNNLDSFLINYTEKQMLEMLIDKYFGDVCFNVLANMSSIVKFNDSISANVVPLDRINIYKKILEFNELSLIGKKDLYNKLSLDLSSYFYDDFRNCQNYAYDLINKGIPLFNEKKFELNDGIKIYELSGEEFIMPIHLTGNKRCESIKWNDRSNTKTLSISIIGNKHLGAFQDVKKYTAVGFKHLNIDYIMHMFHADSFTSQEYSTKRVNEIFTPDELLKKTMDYNEILINQRVNENIAVNNMNPDFLICYDSVTTDDIRIAKELGNIDIVMINTKYYNSKMINHAGNVENYICDYSDLKNHNSFKKK